MLYQISYNNSRVLHSAAKCDAQVKQAVLISYNEQHQWRLLKEQLEVVPVLVATMDDLRGKLGEDYRCYVAHHQVTLPRN